VRIGSLKGYSVRGMAYLQKKISFRLRLTIKKQIKSKSGHLIGKKSVFSNFKIARSRLMSMDKEINKLKILIPHKKVKTRVRLSLSNPENFHQKTKNQLLK
jgi:hypothetical protein